MNKYLKKGVEAVFKYTDKAYEAITEGVSTVASKVDGLPVFASLEKIETSQPLLYDEKHYFVIPYHLSPYGFALHTMRCLPDSVPEINNLPKRRIFHFADEAAEYSLQHYMLNSAKEIVVEDKKESKSSLENLANNIDQLDRKLTYGMLLIGGVAAIFNPLVGAGIAAKALLPGAVGLLSKHGIRPIGEKITKIQLESELKKAEKRVEKEFSEASTVKVINPILQELEFTLRTSEEEHDPLLDPNLADGSITELENDDWRNLTEIAICRVYEEVLNSEHKYESAKLGPKDVMWLKTMMNTRKT